MRNFVFGFGTACAINVAASILFGKGAENFRAWFDLFF